MLCRHHTKTQDRQIVTMSCQLINLSEIKVVARKDQTDLIPANFESDDCSLILDTETHTKFGARFFFVIIARFST